MRLIRGNSWAELAGAPQWFCDAVSRHLAVPIDPQQFRLGARFGAGFTHGDKYYGSLVHSGRYVAAGLTPHIIALAQHYRLPCEYQDVRPRPMGGYPWHSMQMQSRPYQDRVHKACIDQGCGIIDAPPRCLAGSTLIGVHRNGKSYQTTLRALAERELGPDPKKLEALRRIRAGETLVAVAQSSGFPVSTLRHWKVAARVRVHKHRKNSDTLVRYRDVEGFVRLAPLRGVVRAGRKALFLVRLVSGKELFASADHKFLTDRGMQPVHALREGSLVWEEAPQERRAWKKKPWYPACSRLEAHPFASNTKHKDPSSRHRVGWHRLVMEAHLNKLELSAFVARVRRGRCKTLKFLDPKTHHVHHKNGDTHDYALGNLELLSAREHAAQHGRDGGWQHVTARTRLSAVASVSPAGDEETYDLCMPEPHNFLANGIVVSNSGKTNMAGRLVDVYGVKTVYVAPSLPIVKQTYDRFCEWFGEGLVARLDGEASEKEKDISKPIVIATAASAVRQPIEWWRTRELLIVDEFHHAAAETYHQINALAEHIFLRFMFTGTHFRTGDDELAMEAVCSQMLARIPLDELVAHGYLAAPRVFYVRAPVVNVGNMFNYMSLYQKAIVDNEARNALVVDIVGALQARGVPTIVLTRRRKHADLLGELIVNSVVVKGGEQELTGKAVKDFAQGVHEVLIGTTVIGEGVDLPRAAALVYASGGNGGVGQMQSYFRPLTGVEGKTHGRIYDFWDASGQTMAEQSRNRLEYARKYLGPGNVLLT